MENLRIAITGASGLLGSRLVVDLRLAGHTVYALRRGAPSPDAAMWNPETGEISAPERADVLLHFAGRSVAARWSAKVKKEIWDSRIPPTEKLSQWLASLPSSERPKLIISASAVGIYGNRGEEILTEVSPPAPPKTSYLADVCRAWEGATKAAEDAGIRVIHPRFGVVLSKEGGALRKMMTPTKLGLAGPIGPGTQWMSWISLTDVSRLMIHLVESEDRVLSGAVHFVAPHPVRQHEFIRTLGNALHRTTVFPMPSPVVKWVFGEMGEEVLLASQRVSSERIPRDFQFHHPNLETAMIAELS